MKLTESIALFLEKNVPTDPKKWQKWVGKAKQKFDVYPSAYANGWAAKMYKGDGGGWKNESEEPQHVAAGLPQTKELKGKKIGERFIEYLEDNGLKHAAYQTESGEIKIVGLNKEQVKDALKDVVKEYKKLKEIGLSGGSGVGVSLPGGYINGAPSSDDVKKTQNFFKKKVNEEEEGDGESKRFPGHYHLGGGYYSTTKDGEAVKKSDKGQLRTLTPQEKQQKAAEKTPTKPQPSPQQTPAEKKPETPNPTVQKQTPQPTPTKQTQTPTQKLTAAPKQPVKPDTTQMSPEDVKATQEYEKEKEGLDDTEKKAYDFLDGLPPEQKSAAIQQALDDRSWWEKFKQDTVVGSWLSKKKKQFSQTADGIKSITSGRTPPRFGVVQDCSGDVNKNIKEDAKDRQDYLSNLGKNTTPTPKDNKGCEPVHYEDFIKLDDGGNPIYKTETKPVYKQGKKPDPAIARQLVGGNPCFSQNCLGPDDLDSETGYFKKDNKFFDEKGNEVDKKGNILKDGNPIPDTDLLGRPKTKKVKVPQYRDDLTPQQLELANKSNHNSQEQKHAFYHTLAEVGMVVAGVLSGGSIAAAGKTALGMKAAVVTGKVASHSAIETLKHVTIHTMKDVAKHAAAEVLGAKDAYQAGGIGAATTFATGGVLENKLYNQLLIISENEGQDDEKNSQFFQDLLKKTMERMKTYEMTPQQKLQSIKDYKQKKAEGKFQKQTESITEHTLSDNRVKEIANFVEFATKRLKLNERPKIKLVKEAEYLEKAIFQDGSSALGGYIPSKRTIMVVNDGRLIADVLRTIAHEMVHRKQEELGMLEDLIKAGKTGSPIENQANSIAGILLREYGKNNKMIYKEIKEIQTEIDDIYTQTVFLKEYITRTI